MHSNVIKRGACCIAGSLFKIKDNVPVRLTEG